MSGRTDEAFWDAMQTAAVRQYGDDGEWAAYYGFSFGFVSAVCRIRLRPDHSAAGGEAEGRIPNGLNDPVRSVGGKPEGRTS